MWRNISKIITKIHIKQPQKQIAFGAILYNNILNNDNQSEFWICLIEYLCIFFDKLLKLSTYYAKM